MRTTTARSQRWSIGMLALAGAALSVSACSAIPDRLNPTSWFSSENKQEQARPGGPASRTIDTNQPFPSLSSVPEPPKPTVDPAQRLAMARGLEGDRQTAREQDAAIRRSVPAPAATGQGSLVRAIPDVPTGAAPAAPSADPLGAALSPAPAPAAPASAPLPPASAPVAPTAAIAPPVAAPPPSRYPAEPPPGRVTPTPSTGAATQPGVRYAIPPRPPISPPEPLSIQQGAIQSSGVALPAPVQLAAADAFFAMDQGSDAALVYVSEGFQSAPSVAAANRAIARVPSVSAQVAVLAFPNGASQLTAAQRSALREVAAMRERHGGRLWVLGHASHRTPDMPFARHMLVNYGVSVDRAHQVADALRRLGVPEHGLAVSARSDWDPVFFEMMPAGEAENRRVEIYLEY